MKNLILTTATEYYKAIESIDHMAEEDGAEIGTNQEDDFDELASALSLYGITHSLTDPVEDELDMEDLYEDY